MSVDRILIERSIDGGQTFLQIASVYSNVTGYTDNISTIQNYQYRLRTYKSGIYGNYSTSEIVTKEELYAKYWETRYPNNLFITSSSGATPYLTWVNNGSQDFENIIIERSLNSGNTYTEINSILPNISEYNDESLNTPQTSYYRVRYKTSNTYSNYSNIHVITEEELWTNYWSTRYILSLSAVTTSDTTQTISPTVVGSGYDGISYEYSTDNINYTIKGSSQNITYSATGLTTDTHYYWRARPYKQISYGSYCSGGEAVTYPSGYTLCYISNNVNHYPNLSTLFYAIEQGNIKGAIVCEVQETPSNDDLEQALLGPSGNGFGSYYTKVIIYPTSPGVSLNGDTTSMGNPYISLNDASNVIIDGRINRVGNTPGLTITNAAQDINCGVFSLVGAGGSDITLRYNYLKSSNICPSNGNNGAIQLYGGTNVLIEHNNITAHNSRYGRAVVTQNCPAVIRNNNFYDFLRSDGGGSAIYISDYSDGVIISGNSMYETSSLVITANNSNYYFIDADDIMPGTYTITGNYIGGSSPMCGGTAITKTTGYTCNFVPISITCGDITQIANIDGNIIKNINWVNLGSVNNFLIVLSYVTGNIGVVSGNIIGDVGGILPTSFTTTSTGQNFYAIRAGTGSVLNCANNIISHINILSSNTTGAVFYGIYKNSSTDLVIKDNIINNISLPSASTNNVQKLYGIYVGGLGVSAVSGNTVSNLSNLTTATTPSYASTLVGIYIATGTVTATNNLIYNLTTSSPNSNSNQTGALMGIVANANTTDVNVSNNTIFNLSNTYSSFAGCVSGIYFKGRANANIIDANFIRDFSVNSSTTGATLSGIFIDGGKSIFSNNIISLGGNTDSLIYGIREYGLSNNNNSIYFNTIYLYGTAPLGSNNYSICLFSFNNLNTRIFEGNIFLNARSTVNGSDKHYAVWLNYATETNLTLNYNDYWVTGTGGILGYYNGTNIASLPIVSAEDMSYNEDPLLVNAGGTLSVNYKRNNNNLVGSDFGITTDYAGQTRTNYMLGAWEN